MTALTRRSPSGTRLCRSDWPQRNASMHSSMSSLIATPARAQLEQIEGKGLAVVGRGDEQRNAPDLAGIADFGALRQPLEGAAALRDGLAPAQHHALHVVVDVEGAGYRGSPYGSSTWPIVFRQSPICHPFISIMIRVLIMYINDRRYSQSPACPPLAQEKLMLLGKQS